jgi:type III pantothenate kinase
MLLAIDIGNTTVSSAVMTTKKVVEENHLSSHLPSALFRRKFVILLAHLLRSHGNFDKVMICSVVPGLTSLVERTIKSEWKIVSVVIGRDIHVPLKNNYNPKQIGQDRLVGAYAAKILYGNPAIIIDFGTATTFDVVNGKGEYDGGLIVPGIRLSTESLFHKTALLPKIENIKAPKNLVGKNTQDSILSGLFYGYGTMASGLIDLIEKKMKGKAKVIITGGYTTLMKKYILEKVDAIDSHLVYKGINLLDKSA